MGLRKRILFNRCYSWNGYWYPLSTIPGGITIAGFHFVLQRTVANWEESSQWKMQQQYLQANEPRNVIYIYSHHTWTILGHNIDQLTRMVMCNRSITVYSQFGFDSAAIFRNWGLISCLVGWESLWTLSDRISKIKCTQAPSVTSHHKLNQKIKYKWVMKMMEIFW